MSEGPQPLLTALAAEPTSWEDALAAEPAPSKFADKLAEKRLVDAGLVDRSYMAAVERAKARLGSTPCLWMPNELVSRRQAKLDALEAAAKRWEWDENARLRLLDRDPNALDCRHDLALGVFGTDFATWPAAQRDELLDLFAEGGSADEELMDLRGDICPATLLDLPDAVPLYEGFCHAWAGTQESLKTMMLLHVAGQLAERGKHSLLFEYEIAVDLIKQNLSDLGFDRELLNEYVHITPVESQLSTGLVLHWLAKFPNVTLVALDNVTEAISLIPDSSENAAQDVNRTLRIFRNLSHKRGMTTVLLDHLGHADAGRPRGSSVKAHIVDVMSIFEQKTALTRTQPGVLEIRFTKDRGSLLGKGASRCFDIGDGHGNLPVRRSDSSGPLPGVWSTRQQKMIDVLRREHEKRPEEWFSTNLVLSRVGAGGGRTYTTAKVELQRLVDDPTAPVEQTTVKGNETRWRYDARVAAREPQPDPPKGWEWYVLQAAAAGRLTYNGMRGAASVLGASLDGTFASTWGRLSSAQALHWHEERGCYELRADLAKRLSPNPVEMTADDLSL